MPEDVVKAPRVGESVSRGLAYNLAVPRAVQEEGKIHHTRLVATFSESRMSVTYLVCSPPRNGSLSAPVRLRHERPLPLPSLDEKSIKTRPAHWPRRKMIWSRAGTQWLPMYDAPYLTLFGESLAGLLTGTFCNKPGSRAHGPDRGHLSR